MAQQQPTRVDPKIWQSCAGYGVKIPKLHSKVYYFPLGHLEHANPTPNTESLSLINSYRPFVPCIISSVDLFADPQTDEVFTKLLLSPVIDGGIVEPPPEVHDDNGGGDVVSSCKTLSHSDANNGGAFSVPTKTAQSIFPPLDSKATLPTQELSITDVHGGVWEFRHVICGNPKRHMFTHNWSQFVDEKKLVGGDSLIFMKNLTGVIYVGIRRVKKFATAAVVQKKELVVMEAVKLAEKNEAFEVVYYPTASDNFVVDAKVVEDAMKINWNCGMRVKCSVKNGDSIKLQHGTITNLPAHSNRPWHMLQVKWDESKVSESTIQEVSPWQIEYNSDIPSLHPQSPPTKKLKVAKDSALSSDTQGDSSIPMIEFQHSPKEKDHLIKDTNENNGFINPSTTLNCDTLSDGIQEVRQNSFSTTKVVDANNCNAKKVTRSIKLFGATIQVEIDLPDSEIKGDDSCMGCRKRHITCKKIIAQ